MMPRIGLWGGLFVGLGRALEAPVNSASRDEAATNVRRVTSSITWA